MMTKAWRMMGGVIFVALAVGAGWVLFGPRVDKTAEFQGAVRSPERHGAVELPVGKTVTR